MLKVTKNQGFTLSLEHTLLEKPNEGRGAVVKLTHTHTSRLRVNFRFNYTTIRQLLSAANTSFEFRKSAFPQNSYFLE